LMRNKDVFFDKGVLVAMLLCIDTTPISKISGIFLLELKGKARNNNVSVKKNIATHRKWLQIWHNPRDSLLSTNALRDDVEEVAHSRNSRI
jgi:hypothetical protein